MKKYLLRCLAVFMSVTLVVSISLPVSASEYVSKATFWTWMISHFEDGEKGFIPMFLGLKFPESSGVCPSSDDAQHHSNGYFQSLGNNTYKAICDLCGAEVTVRGNDMPSVYDSYTSQLPALGYSSDNALYFQLSFMEPKSWCSELLTWGSIALHLYYQHDLLYNGNFMTYTVAVKNPDKAYNTYLSELYVNFDSYSAPVKGNYFLFQNSGSLRIESTYKGGVCEYIYPIESLSETLGYGFVGSVIDCGKIEFDLDEVDKNYIDGNTLTRITMPAIYLKCIPDSLPDFYSVDSRPTSFSNNGTLAVQTGDGNLSIIDHQNIVDETNNTYYNPVTQTDNSITSWSYDYSNRSYSLTLDNGQTVTVTYGDENITINEGDTVYNVYYVYTGTEPDPTPTPTPGGGGGDTHQHNYTSEDTKAPTCTMPGIRTFTCSECGDSYTISIPATGHDWQVKTEVKTEYGEDGELPQEGYTIYQCSVCGEEYKATAQTGPPPSGGGGSGNDDDGGGSGIGDALSDLFGVIGDLLTGLLSGAIDLIASLISGLGDMFKGLLEFTSTFADFLTAAFAFVPPEIMTALSAGIILMVVFAIIKFIGGLF